MVHPLRPKQRQRTMVRQKTHREMEAGENSRPKGSTEGRERKKEKSASREGKKTKKGKRRKSSESVKKMALQSIYMQCREAKQQNGSLVTRCTKIETGSDTHQ